MTDDRSLAGVTRVADAGVTGPAGLARARDEMGLRSFTPQELFAPRTDLGNGVYTAADWAPDREMCHHHEGSYGITYPDVLLLASFQPPDGDGVLLLADTARVLENLPTALADRFRDGWLLTRTYRPYLGLPWSVALGVATREEASALLDERKIEYAWAKDGTLTTRQHRPAIIEHPVSGEPCWFNDIAFFSQWAVDETERAVLLKTFEPQGMPFNTFAADGSELSAEEFQSLLDAYDASGARVTLGPGELLILDNVRTAHGREPYSGAWQLAVASASL